MDSKAYFEKVMQDFNQFREGRSLRKYCSDEGIDYNWVIKYIRKSIRASAMRKKIRSHL